jgi:hypothetical protein
MNRAEVHAIHPSSDDAPDRSGATPLISAVRWTLARYFGAAP